MDFKHQNNISTTGFGKGDGVFTRIKLEHSKCVCPSKILSNLTFFNREVRNGGPSILSAIDVGDL